MLRNRKNIIFALVVFLLGITNAFQTRNCNQNLLELKTVGMFKCLEARWKESEHLFHPNNIQTLQTNPLGCNFIDKHVACWNEYLGSCFVDDFKSDMARLIDASYEKQEYVSCNRNGRTRKAQYELVVEQLTRKYAQFKYNPDRLPSIIQTDQICEVETFMNSMYKGRSCWQDRAKSTFYQVTFAFSMQSIQRTPIPLCKLIAETVDCFDLKGCLNQQESKFIGNIMVTLYKMAMKELIRINKVFGSFTNLIKTTGKDETAEIRTALRQYGFNFDDLDQSIEILTEDFEVSTQLNP